MAYFNAVLLPSVGFRDRVVDFAKDHYAKIADEYCVSHKVYPHITLCQFRAEEQPMIFIDGVFNPIFENFYIGDGVDIHEGYNWVAWSVKKEDWLKDLQHTVRESLISEGLDVITGDGADYHPHMTFCRVPKSKADEVEHCIVEQSDRPWIFTIGSSDVNGQFLG